MLEDKERIWNVPGQYYTEWYPVAGGIFKHFLNEFILLRKKFKKHDSKHFGQATKLCFIQAVFSYLKISKCVTNLQMKDWIKPRLK